MKKIYILSILFLLLISCNSGEKISSDEYLVINKAIGHILQPYGTTFTDTEELNEIAREYNIDITRISQEDSKKINEIISSRRGYEFAVVDTLAETDAKSGKYTFDLKIDSLIPSVEKLPKAVMNSEMLRFPENYTRVKTVNNPENFLGKIKLERVIFNDAKNKAMIFYTKCKKMNNKECSFNTISLIKEHNEWYIRH